MMLTVLLVLCAAPEPTEIERARGLYNEMRYEAALKSLARAITAPGVTMADRAQIYLYTGLCRHQTGDVKGAQAAFREALAIDRAIALPDGVSPKARLTFERALSELPPLTPTPPPAPPPVLFEQPQVTTPPPNPVVEAPPPPTKVKRWWPMGLSLGLAAAAGGTGAYLGSRAGQTFAEAQNQMFASDGYALAQRSYGEATAANVLFAVAGAAAVFALIAAFVF